MGKIECQLTRRPTGTMEPFCLGPFGIEDQFGGGFREAGHGRIVLRHHIGLLAYAETGLLVAGHGRIIGQHHRQFAKGRARISGKGLLGQFLGQVSKCSSIQRQRLLPIEQMDLHGDRDSFHAEYLSVKKQKTTEFHSGPPV